MVQKGSRKHPRTSLFSRVKYSFRDGELSKGFGPLLAFAMAERTQLPQKRSLRELRLPHPYAELFRWNAMRSRAFFR